MFVVRLPYVIIIAASQGVRFSFSSLGIMAPPPGLVMQENKCDATANVLSNLQWSESSRRAIMSAFWMFTPGPVFPGLRDPRGS